jgi:hypothetical protein
VDATLQEEASTPLRLLLMFSFASLQSPDIQAMRLLGGGEINLASMKSLVQVRIYPPTFYYLAVYLSLLCYGIP